MKGAVIQSIPLFLLGWDRSWSVSSSTATFGPKVSPGASHFCVDNGLLIDVAEDCLSAEVVEEIFLGDSVTFFKFWNDLALYLSD